MQTILTQCPRCQTSFKVSDKQLAIAAGMVRCGSCLDVFSAPDNRITIKQPVPAVPTQETFPEDYEEQSVASQQTAPVAPSTPHDTDPYGQEASQFVAPAAVESGSDSAVDTAAPGAREDASANSADDLEFILDYEDDVALGDLVLDDVSQDSLQADALDDRDAAKDNTCAPGEHTFRGESEEEKSGGAGLIHETAEQARNTVVEPETCSVTADDLTNDVEAFVTETDTAINVEAVFPEVDGMSLQETVSELTEAAESIHGPDDSPQTCQEPEEIAVFVSQEFAQQKADLAPAAEQDPGSLILDEPGDSSDANIATTDADDAAVDDQQTISETATDDVQTDSAATAPDEFFAYRPADADDDHESLDVEDSFTAAGPTEADDLHTPGFSALSTAAMEEIELTALRPQPQPDKTELREYLAELEDADALEPLPSATMESIEEEPLTFEVRSVFRKYATTFGWSVLSLALLAALVLQVVANNLEFMQRSPSYSRYMPLFCKFLDCPEPEGTAAIEGLRSEDLLVRSHPSVPDALEVSFIFSNDASMPRAFPLIELSFMDSSRRLMANRLFRPDEYLPPELDALGEMPANSSVQVMMEMSDPGSDAVNYAITFRDPLTEARP